MATATISERGRRDRAALEAFATTMAFAHGHPAGGLSIGGAFNSVVGLLPSPLSQLGTALTLAAGIYDGARSETRGADLARWIAVHNEAAGTLATTQFDRSATFAETLRRRLDRLADDRRPEAERERERWEEALLDLSFSVPQTSRQLELHLYEEWCRAAGGHFVHSVYRTDRLFPGHEELGEVSPVSPHFGARQITAPAVPPAILARLKAMRLDPARALPLPTTVHHHEPDEAGRMQHTRTSGR